MKRTVKKSKLKLSMETVKTIDLGVVVGGAATNGDTGCLSEATGCPSRNQWSCMNYSCPNN